MHWGTCACRSRRCAGATIWSPRAARRLVGLRPGDIVQIYRAAEDPKREIKTRGDLEAANLRWVEVDDRGVAHLFHVDNAGQATEDNNWSDLVEVRPVALRVHFAREGYDQVYEDLSTHPDSTQFIGRILRDQDPYDEAARAYLELERLHAASRGELDDVDELPHGWLLRRARSWRHADVIAYRDAWLHAARIDRPPAGTLVAAISTTLRPGALIRVAARAGEPPDEQMVRVDDVVELPTGDSIVRLAEPLRPRFRTREALGGASELRLDLTLALRDLRETHANAALDPRHPRFLWALVARDSVLLGAPRELAEVPLAIDPSVFDLGAGRTRARFGDETTDDPDRPDEDEKSRVVDGSDGAQETTRAVFFDPPKNRHAMPREGLPEWLARAFEVDPENERSPFGALDRYDDANEREPISLVNLPDLVHVAPVRREPRESPPRRAEPGRFEPCAREAPPAPTTRTSTWPGLADDRDDVAYWARELVRRCGPPRRRIAVLDLPPGLPSPESWARTLRSDRAAIYGPWLRAAPAADPTGPLLTVPPGGAVCGIVARVEAETGVHAAPSNAAVRGAVGLQDDGRELDAARLFESRINAIRRTERGLLLLGSRTTSADRDWTHVNVRRIVDFLARQLELDNRWAVFEPNERLLWRRLALSVERRLEALWRAGALLGTRPQEAYFVRTGPEIHDVRRIDAGQAVVEVGVAPAAPAEFIVLRLMRTNEGEARVEELRA